MKITTLTQTNPIGLKNQKNLSTNSNSKDLSKIEKLKQEINNGTYKIDLQKTAEAISSYLLK